MKPMEQIQKQHAKTKREQGPVDGPPETIDESELDESTELILGKIAVVLSEEI